MHGSGDIIGLWKTRYKPIDKSSARINREAQDYSSKLEFYGIMLQAVHESTAAEKQYSIRVRDDDSQRIYVEDERTSTVEITKTSGF